MGFFENKFFAWPSGPKKIHAAIGARTKIHGGEGVKEERRED